MEDLRHYKNLGEFFRRELKPHVRPIDDDHVLVSHASMGIGWVRGGGGRKKEMKVRIFGGRQKDG